MVCFPTKSYNLIVVYLKNANMIYWFPMVYQWYIGGIASGYQWYTSGISVLYQLKSVVKGDITTVIHWYNNRKHWYYRGFTTEIHCFTSGNTTKFYHWFPLVYPWWYPWSFQRHFQWGLDPDQDLHSVVSDLGPNCLQRLSADNKRRS